MGPAQRDGKDAKTIPARYLEVAVHTNSLAPDPAPR